MVTCNRGASGSITPDVRFVSAKESNVDKLLTEFERAAETFLLLAQKALEGDFDAITETESPLFLQKISEIALQLQFAEERGEITAAHKARMDGIQKKLENLVNAMNIEEVVKE